MMIDRGCIPFPGKGAICHGTHPDRRGRIGNQSSIMKNLRLVGHTCEQVFDGAAAVDAVLTGHFDLVILDVMLPKLSGFEVSEQIRIAGVPIIFVTARDGLNDRLKGLRIGDDYIVKEEHDLYLLSPMI